MSIKTIRLDVTTNGSGDGSATATQSFAGHLCAVEMIDGDYADGVDATISVTGTASGVDYTLLTLTDWNTDKVVYPRVATVGTTGSALTDYDEMLVVGYPKLVIAQGGATKTGGCILYITED